MRVSLFGDNKAAVDAIPAAKRFHKAATRLHKNRPESAYYKKFIGDDIMIVSRPKHGDVLIFATKGETVEKKEPEYETIPTWETVAKDTGATAYMGSGLGLMAWSDSDPDNLFGYGPSDPVARLLAFDYKKKRPYALEIVIYSGDLVDPMIQDIGATMCLIPKGLGVFMAKRRAARAENLFKTSTYLNAVYEDFPDHLPVNKDLAFGINEETGHLVHVEHEGDYEYGELSARKVTSEYIGYESSIITETVNFIDAYSDPNNLRQKEKFGVDMVPDMRFTFTHKDTTHSFPGKVEHYDGYGSRYYYSEICSEKKFIRISDRVILCANISCTLGKLQSTDSMDSHNNCSLADAELFCDATYTGKFELIGLRFDGTFARVEIPVNETLAGAYLQPPYYDRGKFSTGAIFRIPNIHALDTDGIIPEMNALMAEYQFPLTADNLPSGYKALRYEDWGSQGIPPKMRILGQSYMCISGTEYMFNGYDFVITSPSADAVNLVYKLFGDGNGDIIHEYADRQGFRLSRGLGQQYVEKHSDDLKLFLVKHGCRVIRWYTYTTTNSDGSVNTWPAYDYHGFQRGFTINRADNLEVVWTSTMDGPYGTDDSPEMLISRSHTNPDDTYMGFNTMYPKIFASENMRLVVEYLYSGKISAYHISESWVVTKLFDSQELSVEPIFVHHAGKCLVMKEKIWISLDLIDGNVNMNFQKVAGGVLLDCVDCAGIFYDFTHFVDHISENVFVVKKINFANGSVDIVDTISNCNYFELSPDSSIAIFLKAFSSKDEEGYVENSNVYIVDYIDKPFCFESTDIKQTMVFDSYLYEPTVGNMVVGYRRKFPYGRRGIKICECGSNYLCSFGVVLRESGKGVCADGRLYHALALPNEWSVEETSFFTFKKMFDLFPLGQQSGGGFSCPFRTEDVTGRYSRKMSTSPQVLTGQFSDGFKRREKYKEFYSNKRLNKFIVVATFWSERIYPEIASNTGKPIYTLRRRKDGLSRIEAEKFEVQ